MLIILKYQPDANYNFDYDYLQFGSLNIEMNSSDKWQLLKWNWIEDTENNCWSHV